MKSSIAITLIVIAGIFGFVSGYSIGKKNGSPVTVSSSQAPVSSASESKTASGGYGAPTAAAENPAGSSAPAATTESPKAAAAPGYGQ